MAKVLVLSVVLHLASTGSYKCTPGITGVFCASSQDIVHEFRPTIVNLGEKISTLFKITGDTIISTRNLIHDNIANAKNFNNQKFLEARNLLNAAKIEAAAAPQKIKTCIMQQNVELSKIPHGNFLHCKGNFSSLEQLRRQIFRIKQVTIDLVPGCSRLNPLESERENLRMCLTTKIADLRLQLVQMEKQFTEIVKTVVNFSTNCVMKESGEIHSKIGTIEGAVKNCKIL